MKLRMDHMRVSASLKPYHDQLRSYLTTKPVAAPAAMNGVADTVWSPMPNRSLERP